MLKKNVFKFQSPRGSVLARIQVIQSLRIELNLASKSFGRVGVAGGKGSNT